MFVKRSEICLLGLLLIAAFLAPSSVGVAPSPLPFQVAPAALNLSFPSITDENGSLRLASTLAVDLQLGSPATAQATVVARTTPAVDGLNDTLWNSPENQAFGTETVSVPVVGGARLDLHYDSTGGGNGTFAFGVVWNFSAASFALGGLTESNAATVLQNIAAALHIPLNATEQTRTYMNGTWIDATLYRTVGGRIVEFANQLQLIAPPSGVGGVLRFFPWIGVAPAPAISQNAALAIALESINSTFGPTAGTFVETASNSYLDTAHASFGYSFRLTYNESDFLTNGTYLFVAWIDGISGQAVRLQEAHVVPGGTGNLLPPWAPLFRWPGILIPIGGSVGGALLILSLIEGVRMSLLYGFAFLFFRLRREHALEHFMRGRIFEVVRSTPGITFSEVRDRLGLSNGVAAYHLMVLEKMGLTLSRKDGRLRLYFSHDAPEKVVKQHLSPLQYAILDALSDSLKRPVELAIELRTSRQRVAYNLKRLQKAGFIAPVPGGHKVSLTHDGEEARNDRTLAAKTSTGLEQ